MPPSSAPALASLRPPVMGTKTKCQAAFRGSGTRLLSLTGSHVQVLIRPLSAALARTRMLLPVGSTGTPQPVLPASSPAEDAAPMSREEELLRERLRMTTTGITSYAFDAASSTFVFPLGGARDDHR
jgi:hypothetical protein